MIEKPILVTTVKHCARCDQDHEMEFREFTNPVVDNDGTVWDWWGICPNTGEPVLLKKDKVDN